MRSRPAFRPSAASKIDAVSQPAPDHAFSLPERQAVYRAIHERRDMRHFSGGTVRRRVAAAPAVGRAPCAQRRLHAALALYPHPQPAACVKACMRWSSRSGVLTAQALGEREDEFMTLKVQGVLDAAEVLVVALPPGREAHVFGRRTLPRDGPGLRRLRHPEPLAGRPRRRAGHGLGVDCLTR